MGSYLSPPRAFILGMLPPLADSSLGKLCTSADFKIKTSSGSGLVAEGTFVQAGRSKSSTRAERGGRRVISALHLLGVIQSSVGLEARRQLSDSSKGESLKHGQVLKPGQVLKCDQALKPG